MLRTRFLLCGLVTLVAVSSAEAQADVDFKLVAVSSPTGTDTVNPTLPTSITNVCDGDTYYIELWTSDVGTTNTGVSSAYVDLNWTGAAATANSVNHGGIYDTLPDGTIGAGQVDELGGSYLSATGAGISPEWARVGYVQLTAGAAGSTVFSMGQSATGVAALGRGQIAWGNIDITSAVTITVQGNATADASIDQTICKGGTALMAGSATNALGTLWTTSGTGSFDFPTTLTPIYTPSQADQDAGSVTLTLTATATAPCSVDDADSMILTFQGNATADAGVDQTICDCSTATMAGATTNSTGCIWTTGGDGTFDVASSLTAVYTPGATDLSIGSATLTLTCAATSPCTANGVDSMLLTIDPAPATPTSLLATPSTICEGDSSTLSATVGVGEEVDWYTGSCGGTFVGTGSPVVSPAVTTTYYARARITISGYESIACATVVVTVDYCISGNIAAFLGTPISGISLTTDFGGGSATTDVNGDYLLTVPHNWTGTMTPCKAGWRFAPDSLGYVSVTASVLNADFTSTLIYDLDPPGGGDEFVGVGDLSYFVWSWLKTVPPGNLEHDYNCDLTVGIADFSYFVTAWLKNVVDGTILFHTCQDCGGARSAANPLSNVQLELRLLAVAEPSPDEWTQKLPPSVRRIGVGKTYFVEMWVRNLDWTGPGVTSAYARVTFDADRSAAREVWPSQVFGMLASGSIDESVVWNLGGSALESGVGTEGWWTHVATIEVEAIAQGQVRYDLQESNTGVAAYGRGEVPWENIEAFGITVRHVSKDVRPLRHDLRRW